MCKAASATLAISAQWFWCSIDSRSSTLTRLLQQLKVGPRLRGETKGDKLQSVVFRRFLWFSAGFCENLLPLSVLKKRLKDILDNTIVPLW